MTQPSPTALALAAREALPCTHDCLQRAAASEGLASPHTGPCAWREPVALAMQQQVEAAVAEERERSIAIAEKWERDWPVPVSQIIVEIAAGARAHEEGGE